MRQLALQPVKCYQPIVFAPVVATIGIGIGRLLCFATCGRPSFRPHISQLASRLPPLTLERKLICSELPKCEAAMHPCGERRRVIAWQHRGRWAMLAAAAAAAAQVLAPACPRGGWRQISVQHPASLHNQTCSCNGALSCFPAEPCGPEAHSTIQAPSLADNLWVRRDQCRRWLL